MSGAWSKLIELFPLGDKARAAGLLAMIVLGAGFETIGIGLILPFIGILSTPDLIQSHPTLRGISNRLGVQSPETFLIICASALLIYYIIKNTYLALVVYLQNRFIYERQSQLSTRLFRSYLDAPYTLHLQRNTSESMKNFATEIGSMFTGVIGPSFTLLAELCVLLMVTGFLFTVEPVVTTIAVAALVGALGGFSRVQKPVLRESSRIRALQSGARLKWAGQGLGGIKEIKVACRQDFFADAFSRSNREYAKASGTFATANVLPRLFVETVALGGILGIVIVLLVKERPLVQILPTLSLFAVAALRIMPSASRIFAALASIRFYMPTIDAVHADMSIVGSPTTEAESRSTNSPPGDLRDREFQELELRDVSYSYPVASEKALRNVSLQIPRGTAVAFVGPSGAGKSTLVDLLLGLLIPSDGEFRVDGHSIHSSLKHWQRRIGYVPQVPYLVDDSIRRNVAFAIADDQIDDARVWQCLAAARLDSTIRNLPLGISAMVGERGARLSGGERQRIAIARALYREPEILVFDEATAALDASTEEDVARTIMAMKGARTLVLIAHRLNTLKSCDRLYFIEGGKITAGGTYDELYATCTQFRVMAMKQRGDLDSAHRADAP